MMNDDREPPSNQNPAWADGPSCFVVVVQQWDGEFVLDFVGVDSSPRVVARLVMLNQVCVRFVESLQASLQEYRVHYGEPEALTPEHDSCRSGNGQEARLLKALHCVNHVSVGLAPLYRELNVPEPMLGGIYTNHARIRFNREAFFLEFLATFLPRAVEVCRLRVPAQALPGLVDSLDCELRRYSSEGEARSDEAIRTERAGCGVTGPGPTFSAEIPASVKLQWPTDRDLSWETRIRHFVSEVASNLAAAGTATPGQPLGRTCRLARLSGNRSVYGHFQQGPSGLEVSYRTTDADLSEVYEGEPMSPPFLAQPLDLCSVEWLTSLIAGNLVDGSSDSLSAELARALAGRLLTSDPD